MTRKPTIIQHTRSHPGLDHPNRTASGR